MLRLVRDVCSISGFIEADTAGEIKRIVLNRASPAAGHWVSALQALLQPQQIKVTMSSIWAKLRRWNALSDARS